MNVQHGKQARRARHTTLRWRPAVFLDVPMSVKVCVGLSTEGGLGGGVLSNSCMWGLQKGIGEWRR